MVSKTLVKELTNIAPKILDSKKMGEVNQSIYYSRTDSVKKQNYYEDLSKQLEEQVIELLEKNSTKKQNATNNDLYSQLVLQYKEQQKTIQELQEKLQSLHLYGSPFVPLFQSLPTNYPVNKILLNGTAVEVTKFINVSKEGAIAHFTNEGSKKSFDINKIDGIHWGREDLNS